MKAKEQAKSLFDKFMTPIDGHHKYPMCFDTAKQCALICVEEILGNYDDRYKYCLTSQYYQEVKQEIQKL